MLHGHCAGQRWARGHRATWLWTLVSRRLSPLLRLPRILVLHLLGRLEMGRTALVALPDLATGAGGDADAADALRLRLLQADGEHAVAERRLGGVGVHGVGQLDRAAVGAVTPLVAQVALARLRLEVGALAALDREAVAAHGDVHVLVLEARHGHEDHEDLLGL